MLIERLLDGMSIDGVPFFEVAWHGFTHKKAGGGWRGRSPPPFASRMLTERLLDGMSIDGTPVLEAGSHGSQLHMRRGYFYVHTMFALQCLTWLGLF